MNYVAMKRLIIAVKWSRKNLIYLTFSDKYVGVRKNSSMDNNRIYFEITFFLDGFEEKTREKMIIEKNEKIWVKMRKKRFEIWVHSKFGLQSIELN